MSSILDHVCVQSLTMQKKHNRPTSGNSGKNRSNSRANCRSVYNSNLKNQTSPVTLQWKSMDRKVSRWSLDATSDQEAQLWLVCPSFTQSTITGMRLQAYGHTLTIGSSLPPFAIFKVPRTSRGRRLAPALTRGPLSALRR